MFLNIANVSFCLHSTVRWAHFPYVWSLFYPKNCRYLLVNQSQGLHWDKRFEKFRRMLSQLILSQTLICLNLWLECRCFGYILHFFRCMSSQLILSQTLICFNLWLECRCFGLFCKGQIRCRYNFICCRLKSSLWWKHLLFFPISISRLT